MVLFRKSVGVTSITKKGQGSWKSELKKEIQLMSIDVNRKVKLNEFERMKWLLNCTNGVLKVS